MDGILNVELIIGDNSIGRSSYTGKIKMYTLFLLINLYFIFLHFSSLSFNKYTLISILYYIKDIWKERYKYNHRV